MATLKAVFKLFDGYSSTIDKINRKTNEATNKILKASGVTDKFNKKLENTGASANMASSGLGKLVGTFISLAAIKKGMDIVDEYTNTASRLALINDGLQTQAELQDKIFAAANRSRGAYGDMADAIAKMGLLAKDAFKSNDELLAFTELVQKSFKIAGADTSEQQGAMRQLAQAMASGRLQGDELVSIMENAPMIYDAIAKYMGKTKGELKKLSSEGAITADIIKNAMFAAADDINKKFEKMPMTFGDIWNKIKNSAMRSFSGVMQSINRLINTEGFQKFINVVTTGFELAAEAVSWLIDTIVAGWDTIGPVLSVIGGVLLAAIIGKLISMLSLWAANIAALWSFAWPVLLVVGIIALAIAAARQLGATWDEIIGFIGGLIGVFATFFYNKFVYMWNAVAAFVNFFGNVFKNPVATIKTLFLDLAVNVIGYIEKIAQGIENLLNKIPGVNVSITDSITKLKDKLAARSSEIKTEADLKTYVQSKEFMDFSEGWTKGSTFSKNLYSNISDKLGSLTDAVNKLGNGFDLNNFGSSNNPLHVTSDDKLKVDMSDEDLKYLRDIAQREYINKFSTATLAPNIQISFGDVHEEADVDKVAGRIRKILQEEIATAAEGSYA